MELNGGHGKGYTPQEPPINEERELKHESQAPLCYHFRDHLALDMGAYPQKERAIGVFDA